jgi:hypothetical protein
MAAAEAGTPHTACRLRWDAAGDHHSNGKPYPPYSQWPQDSVNTTRARLPAPGRDRRADSDQAPPIAAVHRISVTFVFCPLSSDRPSLVLFQARCRIYSPQTGPTAVPTSRIQGVSDSAPTHSLCSPGNTLASFFLPLPSARFAFSGKRGIMGAIFSRLHTGSTQNFFD